MKRALSRILFSLLVVLGFGVFASKGFAAPNARGLLPIFFNQAAMGTVPNHHAALFRFLNPDGSPVMERFSVLNAIFGIPVELEAGETAFSSLAWFMGIVDDCEDQVVRQVVDFESPECLVPDPETTDPDSLLEAIAALPEECLGPVSADPCAEFESVLRFDYGTGVPQAQKILKKEIVLSFFLDGNPLPANRETLQPFKYLLGGGNPEEAPSLVCSEELRYSPIYVYFNFGYQIPSQTGRCYLKGTGTLLPPLSQGEHQFLFQIELGGEPIVFPPVIIIQH